MLYKYHLFSLNIHSDFALPIKKKKHTYKISGIDISIKKEYFDYRKKIVKPRITKPHLFANDEQFSIRIPGIASFYIENGRAILVSPELDSNIKSIQDFIYTVALPILLTQQNKIILRATAIELNGHTTLLLGSSNIGKSSTAFSLTDKGFNIISDEYCVLRRYQENWYVEPATNYVTLWDDVIDKSNVQRNTFSIENAGKAVYKKRVYLHKEPNSDDQYYLINGIVFIQIKQKIGIKEVSNFDFFGYMKNSILREDAFFQKKLEQPLFQFCSWAMTNGISKKIINRTPHLSDYGDFINISEEYCKRQ